MECKRTLAIAFAWMLILSFVVLATPAEAHHLDFECGVTGYECDLLVDEMYEQNFSDPIEADIYLEENYPNKWYCSWAIWLCMQWHY